MSERRSKLNEIVLRERPGGELPDDHPLAKWERDVFWAFRNDVLARMIQAGDVEAVLRLQRHDGMIGPDQIRAAEMQRDRRTRFLSFYDAFMNEPFYICIHPLRDGQGVDLRKLTIKDLTNRYGGDFGFGPG